jgi:SAM-dependent methyltransferase
VSAEPWLLPVDFAAYLEGKIDVDDQSLHPRLLATVCERLRRSAGERILDIGTGTGAMLRRLLGPAVEAGAELVGLDPDPRSLKVAARRLRKELSPPGPVVDPGSGSRGFGAAAAEAGTQAEGLRLSLVRGELLEGGLFGRLGGRPFGLITANAVLDLLPVEAALGAIRELLRPGGWLYATINYDGLTELLPPCEDPGLERRLLRRYDRSMDERRVGGRATAGRWSGRRLCRSLPCCGFVIRDVGASDWMVFPAVPGKTVRGKAGSRHSAPRRVFLRTLLTFMAQEALAGGLEPTALRRWYSQRLESVENGTLALMTHQLDVLAEALP